MSKIYIRECHPFWCESPRILIWVRRSKQGIQGVHYTVKTGYWIDGGTVEVLAKLISVGRWGQTKAGLNGGTYGGGMARASTWVTYLIVGPPESDWSTPVPRPWDSFESYVRTFFFRSRAGWVNFTCSHWHLHAVCFCHTANLSTRVPESMDICNHPPVISRREPC